MRIRFPCGLISLAPSGLTNSVRNVIPGWRASRLPWAITFHAFSVKTEPFLTVGLLHRRAARRSKPRRPRQQLPQHIRQNSAVKVVVDLDWSIDAKSQRNVL